jgi:hypothetical protein
MTTILVSQVSQSNVNQEPSTFGYPPRKPEKPIKASGCCWNNKPKHKHQLTRYENSDAVKAIAKDALDGKKKD